MKCRYCSRPAVEGAHYCKSHLCPCGLGPSKHAHNAPMSCGDVLGEVKGVDAPK